MRRASIGIVLYGIATTSGCASIHPGLPATPLDPQGHATTQAQTAAGLAVWGRELEDLSSPQLGAVEVTFENRSRDFIHIDSVALDFGSEPLNAKVQIPWGEQIDAWSEAIDRRNAVRAANKATALELLALTGESASAASPRHRRSPVAVAGGLAALGAMTALTADSLENRASAAESLGRLPPSHLLSAPFSIPPGLTSQKWILLDTPNPDTGCLQWVVLDYAIAGRGHERVWLRFRYGDGHSEWQRSVCRTPEFGHDGPPRNSFF